MLSSKLPSVDVHLLPLANEVWGKVMFLLASVILFIGVLCMMSLSVWLPGPMFLRRVSVSAQGSLSGVFSVQGYRRMSIRRPPVGQRPPGMVKSGGTHPNGMHSWRLNVLAKGNLHRIYIFLTLRLNHSLDSCPGDGFGCRITRCGRLRLPQRQRWADRSTGRHPVYGADGVPVVELYSWH